MHGFGWEWGGREGEVQAITLNEWNNVPIVVLGARVIKMDESDTITIWELVL